MEEEGDENLNAGIPEQMKKLRSCLRCSLIKTVDQFYDDGCENCPFLRIDGNQDRVMKSTTAYFEGMIALVNPEGSWVAKWQRIVTNVPGLVRAHYHFDFIACLTLLVCIVRHRSGGRSSG
jgi:transcription elongation factor SPT4